ncbi:MAG: DUF2312 domain-containing protein [Methyloligellaceae bacterium]|nr:MAG: DUF2312 domain-containing protein [Alphaproteobacteria bacterium]
MSSVDIAESEIQGTTRDQLRAFVERIERLEEEKAALAADIREVYAEAKAMGFDVKTLRTVVRLRKQDVNERREQEAILATYLAALGMLPSEEMR